MSLYLSEFIYGSIDGIITTFSIVAGSSGGSLMRNVILILGISNVVSDGFSMGISRYVSSQTEIKQGLLVEKNATISALVTFASFVIVGLFPILPFIFMKGKQANTRKIISLIIACIIFFIIGYIKGEYLKESPIESAFSMLGLGLIAAAISFFIGKYVSKYIK
jgi:VIT1/CCC1 family predicted Fe2+/Mn2+ transporter